MPVSPALGISVITTPDVPLLPDPRPAVPEFSELDLADPFHARGPRVHVEAVRAMAKARQRRGQVNRKGFPGDGSFEALVRGGLLTGRGRLTEDGAELADVIADAPLRIRMHGTAGAIPLIFEAHIFGGRALILATDSPSEVLSRVEQEPAQASADVASQIGLDMAGLGRLPVAMAAWAGLSPSPIPAQREYSVPWEQVEAKFAGADVHLPESEIFADQPWSGWAVSTEPATATMTVIGAGPHSFRLTRPSDETALLTWIPAQEVWQDLVDLVRDAVNTGAAGNCHVV